MRHRLIKAELDQFDISAVVELRREIAKHVEQLRAGDCPEHRGVASISVGWARASHVSEMFHVSNDFAIET